MDNYEMAYNTLDCYLEIESVDLMDPSAVAINLAGTAAFLVNECDYDEDDVQQALEDVCADRGLDMSELDAAWQASL